MVFRRAGEKVRLDEAGEAGVAQIRFPELGEEALEDFRGLLIGLFDGAGCAVG